MASSAQLKSKEQLQNGTAATLNNRTGDSMELITSFSWAGDFDSPPKPIPGNGNVTFQHLNDKEEEDDSKAAKDEGSKGVVRYTITNTAGDDLAILLAWSAPANFKLPKSPNRVFGAVAPKSIIEGMTEAQIESILATAGSFVRTSVSGVSLEATIVNNPATGMADLVADFQLA